MKKLRLFDWYFIGLLIAAISAVALRTFALINNFDRITFRYEGGSLAPVANVIVGIFAILFLTYLFLGEKESDRIARTDNAATYIPAGLVSVGLIFLGIEKLGFAGSTPNLTSEQKYLALAAGILALLSAASLFISIFLEDKHTIYKGAFSLAVVLFLAVYSTYLFYNRAGHPTNSVNKTIDQLAYLFGAAFFLFETRVHIGRAKWRPYVAFGLIATLLCLYSSIPSIVIYVVDAEHYLASDSITESILTLALAIYIASRVIQSKNLTPDEECLAAKSIAALADMRQEEILEQRNLSRAQDINDNVEEITQESANYTFDIPYIDPSAEINPDGADIELSNDEE